MTNRPLSDRENELEARVAVLESDHTDSEKRLIDMVNVLTDERDRLARLHELATERTVQLAAVIEQAKAWRRNPFGVTGRGVTAYHELDRILASADADVALREVRAKAWDEGKASGYNEQQKLTVWAHRDGVAMEIPKPSIPNPYLEGAGRG